MRAVLEPAEPRDVARGRGGRLDPPRALLGGVGRALPRQATLTLACFFSSTGSMRYGPRTIRTPLAAASAIDVAGAVGTTALRPGYAYTASASTFPSLVSDGIAAEGTVT